MSLRMNGYSAKGSQQEWLAFLKRLEQNRLCCLDFITGVSTQDSASVHFTGSGTPSDPLIATSVSGTGNNPGNPTQLVGLTPKNGIAFTFIASDSAPALDQAIEPTWTGNHIFKTTGNITDITLSGIVNLITFANVANNSDYGLIASDATNTVLATQIATPLILRTNTVDRITISSTGTVLISNLAGSGNRMVVADAAGLLTTQAIPTTEVPANPTVNVGLTAVNGSATTFMRSDAAPALDQNIAPNWFGIHTFTMFSNPAKGTITLANTNPQLDFNKTDEPLDQKRWNIIAAPDSFQIRALSDDGNTSKGFFTVIRTGVTPTIIGFGSATESIAFNFLGTGSTTIQSLSGTGSRMVVADATGMLSTQAIPTMATGLTLPVATLDTVAVDGKFEYDGLSLYFTGNNARNVISTGAGIYTTDGALTNQRTITGAGFGVTWDSVGLFRITQGDSTVGATYDFNTGTDFLVYDALHSTNLVMNPTTGLQFEYVDVPTNIPISQFSVDNKGIKLVNIQEFANNAAAIAGGLTVGYIYKTTSGGDATLKIVV